MDTEPASSSQQGGGGGDDEVRPVCEYGITLVDSVRATVTVGQFADDVLRFRVKTLLATYCTILLKFYWKEERTACLKLFCLSSSHSKIRLVTHRGPKSSNQRKAFPNRRHLTLTIGENYNEGRRPSARGMKMRHRMDYTDASTSQEDLERRMLTGITNSASVDGQKFCRPSSRAVPTFAYLVLVRHYFTCTGIQSTKFLMISSSRENVVPVPSKSTSTVPAL